MMGRKHSEETKLKMSQAQLGKRAKTIQLKDPLGTLITITNVYAYAKKHGLSHSKLSRVAKGFVKSHKGYTRG